MLASPFLNNTQGSFHSENHGFFSHELILNIIELALVHAEGFFMIVTINMLFELHRTE